MSNRISAQSIWSQMNYVPPRGQCNFKNGLIAAKCTCLRFMLHPLKYTTTFECDGCGHHASHHSMENKMEDEIVKRWAVEKENEEATAARPRKRTKRAIEGTANGSGPGRLTNARGQALLQDVFDENGEGFVEEVAEESESTNGGRTRAARKGR